MKRLAIVSTHPIQYNAPLFRLLASAPETSVHVFFTKEESEFRHDAEFGQDITWDVPLTEGYPHSIQPGNTAGQRKRLIQSIEDFVPDAILIYGWNPPGHRACMRHFFRRVPIWFRGDSILDSGARGWKRWFRRLGLRWVYRHVDRAFHVGQRNQEYFLWAGMNEDQLTLAPHAVDADFFTRDDTARREEALSIRADMGISESDTVFLFAGKLNANKQPIPLATAFVEMLAHSAFDAHLIFVGSGPQETELKQRFEDHTRIHFVGFQNQSRMPIWYRVADILCLVSISETWGLAINEALLCGCGILASDTVGCVPEIKGPRVHITEHSKHWLWPSALINSIPTINSALKFENTKDLSTTATVILHELERIVPR